MSSLSLPSLSVSSTSYSSSSYGFVAASSQCTVQGMPTEAALSSRVHRLPSEVQGKLLAPSLPPVFEEQEVIRLSLHHCKGRPKGSRNSKWTTRGQRVTTIYDAENEMYAGGVFIEQYSRFAHKQRISILRDVNGASLAMCRQDGWFGDNSTTIYGRSALFPESDHKHIVSEAGDIFYPWFRIRDRKRHNLFYPPIYVWNGEEFEPLWRAVPALAKQDGEFPDFSSDAQELLIVDEDRTSLGYAQRNTQGWNVTIAPGVDPAAMLCLVISLENIL